jgi:GDSL-like Lipase/Acylhydrolase family
MLRRAVTCLAVVVVLSVVSAAGAAPATTSSFAVRRAVAATAPLRILVMGDSITSPCGGPSGGYCKELGRLLTQAGVRHEFRVAAVGGVTCRYWADRIVSVLQQHQPDLLLLSCGTNDDTSAKAGRDDLGWSWRTIVEKTRTWRPAPDHVKIGVSFIQYSNITLVPPWLVPSEARANDVIFRNRQYYEPASWFAGTADFQQVPGDTAYLDAGGVHPTDKGNRAYARIWYDALRVRMGWPMAKEPRLCGMTGHRPGYNPPPYTPCSC